jgi:lipopolysaccharide transport system ATP-binding protein
VAFTGNPQTGIDLYMAKSASLDAVYIGKKSKKSPKITRVEIGCSQSRTVQESGQPFTITVEVDFPHPMPTRTLLAVQIFNQFQQPVLRLNAYDADVELDKGTGVMRTVCKVPKLDLNVGDYSLKVHLCEPPGGEVYDLVDSICPFEVVVMGKTTYWGWRPEECVYFVDTTWSVEGPLPST